MKIETRTITIEQDVYIAEDGREFNNEDECRSYEHQLIGRRLAMYSYRCEAIDSAEVCRYVKLDTPDQVAEFKILCIDDRVSIIGIEEPGIYIYTEGTYGDSKTAWINMSKVIDIMNGGKQKQNDQT